MSDKDCLKDEICKALDGFLPRFREIALAIHARPELGNQERFASGLLSEELQGRGFKVQYPYAGLETAFRAERGSGQPPKVAFLAEYDALPELGHACGHNLSGAASAAAAIGLGAVLDRLAGTAVVLGTPDEEGAGGKIDLIEAGAFKDINWAMMVHASSRTILESRYRAARSCEFVFRGKASHAVTSPEEGINALDALIEFYNALKVYQRAVRKDVRIPMIITHGGVRANVIPDVARGEISARAADTEYLNEIFERVQQLARSSAAKVGATVKIHSIDRAYSAMKTDKRMLECFRGNLERLGIPYESEPNEKCGSTDIGNVSEVVPAIHPALAITDNPKLAGHTIDFARASGSEQGVRAMLEASKAMAMTAVDLLESADQK